MNVSLHRAKTIRTRNRAAYYAYGLPVCKSEVGDPDRYLYGGKEFYSLKGINLYDFHARTYAPDIARFMQPDPKADDYHWLSLYTFCGGDPINFTDPDGKNIAVLLASGMVGCIVPLIQNDEQFGDIILLTEYIYIKLVPITYYQARPADAYHYINNPNGIRYNNKR